MFMMITVPTHAITDLDKGYIGELHQDCMDLRFLMPSQNAQQIHWVQAILNYLYNPYPESPASFTVDLSTSGMDSILASKAFLKSKAMQVQSLLGEKAFRAWAGQELVDRLNQYRAAFEHTELTDIAQIGSAEKQASLEILRKRFGLQSKEVSVPCN